MTGPQDTLIAVTIASLKEAPEDWELDQYKATNKALGIEVWIANSYYGMEIRGPGLTAGSSAPFHGWLTPWRRSVMSAVRKIGSDRLLREFAKRHPSWSQEAA